MAKVIQVIEVEVKRGKGVGGDPMRGVMQYWSFGGDLLAENDPCVSDQPTQSIIRGAQMLKDLYGGGSQGAVGLAHTNGELQHK